MINSAIKKLVQYGLNNGLIMPEDEVFTTNRILEILNLSDYIDSEIVEKDINLEEVLNELLNYAAGKGLIENNTTLERDLFDTKLMGVLVPRPSEVINKFNELYKTSPVKATEYFYKLSQDSDYIRSYRIEKDLKWKTNTEYGLLDITINLSKPEKDPKDIAAAKLLKSSSYPQCMLCLENEGYGGRINSPARQNHRIIPVKINGERWGFQYSPYVYYNEHCIVLNSVHTPMKIDKDTFRKLFDFVKLFPHYFVGSNADLPIVGGSILSHDHFQGGNYEFPMAKAEMEKIYRIPGFEDVEVGILKWPMSVIRTRCKDEKRLIDIGNQILLKWRKYNDSDAFIFSNTGEEQHNTITPIARKVKDTFELDLVLRNNITTEEHPMGVYHPHEELHHIKKENIGLIEVMGLAVLPSRLKEEINLLKDYIVKGLDISSNEKIAKHAKWVEGFKPKYYQINETNISKILEDEIGNVFKRVLEHAGVYKRTPEGIAAFESFINFL